MKVTHVITTLSMGGAQTALFRLVTGGPSDVAAGWGARLNFAVRLGKPDLLADAEQPGVVAKREDEPLLAGVVDRPAADLVEVNEDRPCAIEVGTVARYPFAHAERLGLLGAG